MQGNIQESQCLLVQHGIGATTSNDSCALIKYCWLLIAPFDTSCRFRISKLILTGSFRNIEIYKGKQEYVQTQRGTRVDDSLYRYDIDFNPNIFSEQLKIKLLSLSDINYINITKIDMRYDCQKKPENPRTNNTPDMLAMMKMLGSLTGGVNSLNSMSGQPLMSPTMRYIIGYCNVLKIGNPLQCKI
eukprot:TRINITY_DN692_c0_g1_i3.p1 TRINITY_DN692_c0_g1~~TRINITY_DN692_c0_g1_i3.p1  ORF type:complete len:214 (+),score=18.39 TRINITY_DN692_c0_g1_i3:83-643(+)